MDPDQLAALRTPEGLAALAAAAELADADQLVAAAALRARRVEPGLAAAALTQARLRHRAVAKFGPEAAGMFFTRAGLEQATRREVADRRAARLRAAGVRRLADLGCGVGADTLAAARAGIEVHAVDADPGTAAVAAANAQACGLADRVTARCADATAVDLTGFDAVFCDPARRRSGGGRVFDPRSYSPPWDFVAGLADRVPRTVLKLAPGIDHALIPRGTEAEWVSVDGDLVETTFWSGPLADAARRATVLRGDAPPAGLTGTGTDRAPVGPPGQFVLDPDPAVVRAHLVAELAAALGGRLADPDIAYLHTDAPVGTPFGRCLAVTDVLTFSLKRLRALLRDRRVGRVEILKRGSAVDVEGLRRNLRLSGPAAATLVLTRVAGAPTVFVCHPAPPWAGQPPAGQGSAGQGSAGKGSARQGSAG